MTNANSITFDLAWYNILSDFSDSLRRRVIDAVFTFAATGKRPSFKGQAKLAFELIAHEISKQITIPEPSENLTLSENTELSEPSDNSDNSDNSDSFENSKPSVKFESPIPPKPKKPLTEKEIIDKYYRISNVPEPLRMFAAGTAHVFSEERIRTLVEVAVKDMLESGKYQPENHEFFKRLHELVTERYYTVRNEMKRYANSPEINEYCWLDIFTAARRCHAA